MAGAGGGMGESESRTDSTQGLSRGQKTAFEPTAVRTAELTNRLAADYAESPFGFYQGRTGAQMADTDPLTGLARSSTAWMTPFANQEAAKYSAGGSLRGQWSPENTGNIIGGTLAGMAGQLLPLTQDWAKYTTGLPESVMNSRLGFLNATTGANTGLLGGQGSGQSSASGWNANVQVGGSGGKNPFTA